MMKNMLTLNLKSLVLLFQAIFLIVYPVISQKFVDYKPSSEWAWGIEDSTEYFIYTPGNLELGKRYPIALYLHGCCGDSPHAIPHRAADPPVRMWHNFDDNTQDVPTYIISPQTTRGWSQHFESIKRVIDFLVEKRQGDPERIYIVGFSMGGRGLFQFISEYPDYFAAAIPIGMSFFDGDFAKVKDIPIWANQGSEDRWSRELYKFVKETRALNGLELDSAWEWVTGVNPRYKSFEGLGHLVQWETATTQDLTGWAYTKVNDGNKYPQVFFKSPSYREEAKNGKNFNIEINARDPDGTISKVDLYLNNQYHSTLNDAPYKTKIKPVEGDNILEATAFDDKGKKSTATTILVVDSHPKIGISGMPYGRVGAYYSYWLPAVGNGDLIFSGKSLPEGLNLLEDGLVRGIPKKAGDFNVEITVTDSDGEKTNFIVSLNIKPPRTGEVRVENAQDITGNPLPVSKMIKGEDPNFDKDKKPSSFNDKFSFSDLAGYDGLTFIKSESIDSTLANQEYMSFTIDREADIMVAYEKMDNRFNSTVPDWLNDFKKLNEKQIVAQLRYYEVFSKRFPKGKITLPGADKKSNGVATNYFVMVKSTEFHNDPEINFEQLPTGAQHVYYSGKLTSLYGHGELNWKIVSGELPEGLGLSKAGTIKGVPKFAGTYQFTVQVTDEKGQQDSDLIGLEIK